MYEYKDDDGVIIWTGERLKFYWLEHETFPEAYSVRMDIQKTKQIFRKLCRHFKIRNTQLTFWNRKGGRARSLAYGYEILVPEDCSFGLLCHELSHIYNRQRCMKFKHNKRLMRTLKRFIAYCKKKNHWRLI